MPQNATRFERLVEIALLDPASRYATRMMIELQALTMIAVFANFFRVTVEESPGVFTFPSIVTVIEAPSGAGKNSVTRLIERFILNQSFQAMRDFWAEKEKDMKRAWDKESEQMALEKYPEATKKDEDARIKMFLKREKQFFSKKRPIDVFTSTHGSYEGFAFDRAYLEGFGFGAPYVRVEEYGNLIIEMKQAGYLRKMYDSLVELVDNPKLIAKSIKDKDAGTPGSDNMGITCLFTLSNPTQAQKEYINSIILQAVGRRGFLVSETIEGLDHERAKKNLNYKLKELESFDDEVFECFEGVFERLKSGWNDRVIPLSKEARERYVEIRCEVGERYSDHALSGLKSDRKMQVATILKDLDRKTLKIAVLFAVFNHGESNFEVTLDDMNLAYKYSNRFYEASKDYFEDTVPSPAEQILSYVVEKNDVSARELWERGFFPNIRSRSIQPEIKMIMTNEVSDLAEEHGLELLCYKVRKADRYTTRKLTDAELIDMQIENISADKWENSTIKNRPGGIKDLINKSSNS